MNRDRLIDFGHYIVPTTVVFTVVAFAVTQLSVSPFWAFTAGFALSIPVKLYRNHVQSWQSLRADGQP